MHSASAGFSQLWRDAQTLYVGGLFPMGEGWGRENAAHFELAARLINNKSDGWFDKLLPNTTLRVRVEDLELPLDTFVMAVGDRAGVAGTGMSASAPPPRECGGG